MTAPAEHGIIFTGTNVPAIREGRKTQTRRVITKNLPEWMEDHWRWKTGKYSYMSMCGGRQSPDSVPDGYLGWCPYGQVGDLLYVRETWSACLDEWNATKGGSQSHYYVKYAADKAVKNWPRGNPSPKLLPVLPGDDAFIEITHPSIHMPKWAARTWLELTDIRVQRLQEISSEDAWAEGCRCDCTKPVPMCGGNRDAFRQIWESINAKRGYGWDVNPFVWALTFKEVQR